MLESVYKVIKKGRMSTIEEEVLSCQKRYSINLSSSLSPVNVHHISGWLCIGEGQITRFQRLSGIGFELTLIPEIKMHHCGTPASVGCYRSRVSNGVASGPSHTGYSRTPNPRHS